MKKSFAILFALMSLVFVIAGLRTITQTPQVDGNILHTMQSRWVVIDETTSTGTEPTALAAGERTKYW
jgi:hypothetical protein